jgi:hypothetical protein
MRDVIQRASLEQGENPIPSAMVIADMDYSGRMRLAACHNWSSDLQPIITSDAFWRQAES